jgi:hypothetical protein
MNATFDDITSQLSEHNYLFMTPDKDQSFPLRKKIHCLQRRNQVRDHELNHAGICL